MSAQRAALQRTPSPGPLPVGEGGGFASITAAPGGGVRRTWPMLALGALLWAGCSPTSSLPSGSVHSRFFTRVEIIGTRGTGAGQFSKPRSVAVDQQDNLYVADMTGRVQAFSPDGQYLRSWRLPPSDLGKPKGMACDADGNIVVVEPHYQRINHFTPEGALVVRWGESGTNAGQFSMPRAVAVTPQGDLVVVEYTRAERVQVFGGRDKQLVRGWGRAGSGPGEFNRAEGVAVGRDGRVFVADSCNHRIQVFRPDGRWQASFGRAGTGLGELSYPYDVCIDATGVQFVCEFGNSRIQVFGPGQDAVEVIGGPGSLPGRFNNPWSIALDSHGNLYVADSQNHRVQKLVRR